MPSYASLYVAEIELYSAAGTRLSPDALSVTASSERSTTSPQVSILDRNPQTHSSTVSPADARPSLTISYPCPSGATGLSRVAVRNRDSTDPLVTSRINDFQMDFLNASGSVDAPSFRFAGGNASYDITPAVGEL